MARDKLGKTLSKSDILEVAENLEEVELSSANSINLWRLVPQMTQYFVTYSNLLKKGLIEPGEEIVFSIPSGNLGHFVAGLFAKKLGLPVKKFIVATNENDIVAKVVNEGVFPHRSLEVTPASAMDILDPSNLERLLELLAQEVGVTHKIDYEGMKKDIKDAGEKIAGLKEEISKLRDIPKKEVINMDMTRRKERTLKISNLDQELAREIYKKTDLRKYGVTEKMLQCLREDIHVVGESVSTPDLYEGMFETYETTGVVPCPHTEVGILGALRQVEKDGSLQEYKVAVLGTANPGKFPEHLEKAGIPEDAEYHRHPELEKLKYLTLEELEKPNLSDHDLFFLSQRVKYLHNEIAQRRA
jgi:threonine synthase